MCSTSTAVVVVVVVATEAGVDAGSCWEQGGQRRLFIEPCNYDVAVRRHVRATQVWLAVTVMNLPMYQHVATREFANEGSEPVYTRLCVCVDARKPRTSSRLFRNYNRTNPNRRDSHNWQPMAAIHSCKVHVPVQIYRFHYSVVCRGLVSGPVLH